MADYCVNRVKQPEYPFVICGGMVDIYRYIFDVMLYLVENFEAADVNGDGMVSNLDILKLYRYIYNPNIYTYTLS